MTIVSPLKQPAAPAASQLLCPTFPGSVAGSNSLRSNFASLPQCLLQRIFARDHIGRKLVCQTVCRAWRAALSCEPKGTWGRLLVVSSGFANTVDPGAGQTDSHVNVVVLMESDLPYVDPGASFVNWLCQRAVGFSCVTLELATANTRKMLPHLLLSLANGAWQSPERPPVHLKTGDLTLLHFPHGCRQLASVVQSLSMLRALQAVITQDPPDSIGNLTMLTCLTRLVLLDAPHLGNLTELRLMPHLQSLDLLDSEHSLHRAASFVNLQALDLRRQRAPSWDLSCCTRLTELSLSIPPHFLCLSLPHGEDVQLQVLKACKDDGDARGEDYVLEHLASASKLTHLAFNDTCPSTLRDGHWPSQMPYLRDISLLRLHAALPEQWLSYPQLTYLNLNELYQADLPTWFSNMTQLSSLHVSNSSISVFPDCLLSLSQLQSLHLNNTKMMVIPLEITRIAVWANLNQITLRNFKPGRYDLDSRMHLLDLQSRLASGHCVVRI